MGCDRGTAGPRDNRVDVWYGACGDVPVPDRRDARWGALAADEWARCERYALDRDRRQFAAARLLVRNVLSRYAPVPPAAWQFEYSPLGKPTIGARVPMCSLSFNHSHTRDLVACAVAGGTDVGIDVECLDRQPGPHLAPYCLSPTELAHWGRLDAAERHAYFFRQWTLKEAYAKALGIGLSLPFREVSFSSPLAGRATIVLEGAWDDDPTRWQFFHTQLPPRHVLAVAVRQPAEPDIEFTLRRWEPWESGEMSPPTGRGI